MKVRKWLSGFMALMMALSIVVHPVAGAETGTQQGEPALNPAFGFENDLLLHTTFDTDTVEGTTVKDLSGKNHNGTLTGPLQLVPGISGNAVMFTGQSVAGSDGTKGDRYVDYGKSAGIIPATENFTVSVWFKSIGQATSNACLLGNKDYSSGGNPGFVFGIVGTGRELAYNYADAAKKAVEMAPGKGTSYPKMLGVVKDSKWHHLACTFDRKGNMIGYVDGQEAGRISISEYQDSIDAGLNLVLGAGGNYTNAASNCYMDELRVYSGALSAANVNELYQEFAGSLWAEKELVDMQAVVATLRPSVLFPQTAITAMRDKLNTAAAAAAEGSLTAQQISDLTAEYAAFCDGSEPLASFHVITDVHVSTSADANAQGYVAAMEGMKDLNADTTIAFVNIGDNTQSGQASEYNAFYQLTAAKKPVDDAQTLILMGNHDVRGADVGGNWNADPSDPTKFPYWATAKNLYITNNAPYMPESARTTLYHTKELGGYTFIMLNTELGLKDAMYMSDAQLAWFEQTMKEAYEKDPTKPIFIISHQALNDTHWRSNTLNGFDGVQTDGTGYPYQTGKDWAVKAVMAKYPNGIFLSGHIHNGFGVASVVPRAYGVNVDVPSLNETENGVRDRGVGYEVMIYGGYVAFRARNFITNTWLPQYDVVIPVGGNGYPQLIQKLEEPMSSLEWYSKADEAKLQGAFGAVWGAVNRYYNQAGISYKEAPPKELIFTPGQLADLSVQADAAWENIGLLDAVTRLPKPRPNSFDELREAWRAYLLGGTGTDLDLTDPAVDAYVQGLNVEASAYWNALIRSSQPRTSYIFPDLDMTQLSGSGTTQNQRSANIVTTLSRLRMLALAWATKGCDLYQGDYVRDEIISATDYVVNNYYKLGKYTNRGAPGNWYHWEISAPANLGNIAMVMYDVLGSERVALYGKTIQYYAPGCDVQGPNSPGPVMTGGNLLLKANGVAQAGILLKSGDMLENVRRGVKAVISSYNDPAMMFSTGNPGDGFYADGSYIQHQALPYIAGYGADLYNNFGVFSTLLKGTEWEIKYGANEAPLIYDFVFSGVEPFIYQTRTMDLVTGRAIVRNGYTDRGKTADILSALVPMSGTFPTAEQNERFDRMMKYYLSLDPQYYYERMSSIYSIRLASELLNDQSVQPRSDYALTKTFAMDRTVHITPNFGLGIAMQSTRTFSHEIIGEEGKRTWNIANGMVFLYDADENQYGDGYWCSVDPTRLPGITTEHVVYANGRGSLNANIYDWTGGSSIGSNGVAGMRMKAMSRSDNPSSYAVGPRTGADMKKSYFLFGDRILMLGSSITSGTGDHVETVVDNRKIKPDGTNAITVDGAAASLTGIPTVLENPSWLHVAGNVAGADVGYYFPKDIALQALKETRTGNWADQGGDSGTATGTYATFYVDHGVKPTDATYAYMLLPGKSAKETAAYATAPDVEILRQDGSVHAARDKRQNILAANFWEAGSVAGITVSAPASVTVGTKGDLMTVGVSDPTQRDVPITLSMAAVGTLVSKDATVTVDADAPFIKFSVNTAKSLGGTHTATFKLTKSEGLELVSAVTRVKDITVPTGTPFSALGLPASGVFVATDAAEHTLPILWARGTYTPNTYGVHTVVGTPVLPEGMANSMELKLEVAVKVSDGVLAIGDTYVNDGAAAANNYGKSTSLAVKLDNTGYQREALFQFDLTGVPETYKTLEFVFQGSYDPNGWQGGALYRVGDNWDADTVSWNTRSARVGGAIKTFGRNDFDQNSVVRLDITAAVTTARAAGETKISFAVVCTGTQASANQMSIQSLESAAAQKPSILWTQETLAPVPVDKENLAMLVDVAEGLDLARFQRYDDKEITAAAAAAKQVLSDENATMNQINDAEDAILVHLLALRVKVLPGA